MTILSTISYANKVCGADIYSVIEKINDMNVKKVGEEKDLITLHGKLYHINSFIFMDKKYENGAVISVIVEIDDNTKSNPVYQIRLIYNDHQVIWNRIIVDSKLTDCLESSIEKISK